jgi:Calcium/calmodulin dependent protein kinase II Association.
MRRIITLATVGMLLAVPAHAQKGMTAEQEVQKLSAQLDDAELAKKDRATMQRLYADDYVYLHSNGRINNKSQEIAEYTSSDLNWTAHKTSDVRIRMYHDAAIMTGTQTLTGSAKGYVSGARRFTQIWVKRNGHWQTVGGQSTIVPPA